MCAGTATAWRTNNEIMSWAIQELVDEWGWGVRCEVLNVTGQMDTVCLVVEICMADLGIRS